MVLYTCTLVRSRCALVPQLARLGPQSGHGPFSNLEHPPPHSFTVTPSQVLEQHSSVLQIQGCLDVERYLALQNRLYCIVLIYSSESSSSRHSLRLSSAEPLCATQ